MSSSLVRINRRNWAIFQTYAADHEAFDPVLFRYFCSDMLCCIPTRIVIDGNIAALSSEFLCHESTKTP